MLDRLGWSIEEPTTMKMIVADGTKAVPLGKVRDVPVRFGSQTITIDMVVTESTFLRHNLREQVVEQS